VVIIIVGVLVALLLPALQSMGESGRRQTCQHNLNCIGRGLQNHMMAYGCLPPGVPSGMRQENRWITGGIDEGAWFQGPNWAVNILAQMDRPKMYNDAFDAMKARHNAAAELESAPGNIGRTTPGFYICPSADAMTPEQRVSTYGFERISKGNYAACFGSDTFMTSPAFDDCTYFRGIPYAAGAFGVEMVPGWDEIIPPSAQRKAHPAMRGTWIMGNKDGNSDVEIIDGMSNTLAISEVLGYDSRLDGRGGWVLAAMGSSNFTARLTPNSDLHDVIPICDKEIRVSDRRKCIENRENGLVFAAPRSRHTDGVNVVMCDGTVKFVSDSIDRRVWQAVSTRAGNHLIERNMTIP